MPTIFDTGYTTYRDMLTNRMLMKECRIKNLRDLCLECVGKNLNCMRRPGYFLHHQHKELIIERLAFHDGFTESYLPHVTYNLFSPKLERINLYKCNQIDERWMKQLANSKCKLRFLTIHGCENVNDVAVRHITQDQDELVELELRKLKITKKGLIHVKSHRLVKLDLRGCGLLDNTAIQSVVSANPSIQILVLVKCTKMTDAVLPVVAQALNTNLEHLDLAEVSDAAELMDTAIQSLAEYCPNLKSLDVLGCRNISSKSIQMLFNNCSHLENLDLSYCAKLIKGPNAAQEFMLGLPSTLKELSLNGIQLEDKKLLTDGMGRLTKLNKLKLCGLPALDNETLHEIMRQLGDHLEYFDISGSVLSSITDEGMKSIATYCRRLNTLGIGLLKNITGVTLLPLLQDPQRGPLLKRLLLCHRNLDISVIHAIADNCPDLEHLNISGLSIITDEVLHHLATNCTHITDINIKACKNVTDEGVLSLATHCPLCVVVLSGLHNITDKSILGLANNCPYMEELYLNGCERVSEAAVSYLLDTCIPRVYISHRNPNSYPLVRNLDTNQYERV